ncbi:hypothetical protein A2U01_0091024, partial [Trifolium medium]|nr:hypothetical protein [Trifolium medium]
FDLFYANSFSKVTSSTEPSVEKIEFHDFFCLHFDSSFVESFEVWPQGFILSLHYGFECRFRFWLASRSSEVRCEKAA